MYLKCVNHLCLVTTSEAEFREVEMLCVFPFGGAIYKWTEDIVAIVNVTAVNISVLKGQRNLNIFDKFLKDSFYHFGLMLEFLKLIFDLRLMIVSEVCD